MIGNHNSSVVYAQSRLSGDFEVDDKVIRHLRDNLCSKYAAHALGPGFM